MDFLGLKGKKIVVTGASSGIGKSTASLLAQAGAEIVLCGRNKETIEEARSKMCNPSAHRAVTFDVKNFDSYKTVFDEIISDGKKMNGFVHCAGAMKVVPARVFSPEIIDDIFDTNIKSFLMISSFYLKKKYAEGGCLVGVSSVNSHNPQTGMSIYAASKAGIEAATKTLAIE